MATWIGRAVGNGAAIEELLAACPPSVPWRRPGDGGESRPGDRVFVWLEEGGDGRPPSGIVAEGVLATAGIEPASGPAAGSTAAQGLTPGLELELRMFRVEPRRRFAAEWFENDPVIDRTIVRDVAAGRDRRLTDEQADRLHALWSRAKERWTYAETVAGLWAYRQTLGGPLSKLPGSPIAVAATATGRVMQGMYNKVQHFRGLDPGDRRKGLPTTSVLDREVWARFADPRTGRLRDAEVEAEFDRFWAADLASSIPAAPEAPADASVVGGTLAELLARYEARRVRLPARPPTRRTSTLSFDRDALVVAIALSRAERRCEVPDCTHPLFASADGAPFVEVHHVEPLSEGGADTPENVACVCPSHHREAHHGARSAELRRVLAALRSSEATVPPVGGRAIGAHSVAGDDAS